MSNQKPRALPPLYRDKFERKVLNSFCHEIQPIPLLSRIWMIFSVVESLMISSVRFGLGGSGSFLSRANRHSFCQFSIATCHTALFSASIFQIGSSARLCAGVFPSPLGPTRTEYSTAL